MASERTIDLGAPADNPQQPEHLTIAVIESEHRVATETNLGSDCVEQQQGAGEAVGSPDRISAEEQKEQTNREVSETIQKLDSMLLEAGGEVTVPLENIQESSLVVSIGETPESVGEPVLVLPDKVSEDNNESGGETLLVVIPGSGEEACKSGEETSKSGGETLLVEIHGSEVTSKSGEETSKSEGGTLLVEIQESGEVTSKSGEDTSRLGEETLLVVIPGSAEEASKSVEVFSGSGGKSSKLEGATSQLGGETLLVEIPGSEETSKSEGGTLLVEVIDLVKETSKVGGETLLVEIPGSEETSKSGGETLLVEIPGPGEETSKSGGKNMLVGIPGLVEETSKSGSETLLVEIPGSVEDTSRSGGESLLVEIPGSVEETSKSGGDTFLVEIPGSVEDTSRSGGESLLVEIPGSVEETSKSGGDTLLVEIPGSVEETSRSGGESLLVEIPGAVEETSKSGGDTLLVEIPGSETVLGTETPCQVPDPTSHFAEGDMSRSPGPHVTLEGDPSQMVAPGADSLPPDSWIETLVQNIVMEVVATEGTCVEVPQQEVTDEWQQVRFEQRQVTDSEAQVAPDSGDSAVQVCEEEVTPEPVTVPSREGTSDPGQPAACREKEWPPLICTGSEARAGTGEPGHTQQPGTDTEHTPAMKDWEPAGEVVILTPETPIEREIRLAMEREAMLRQERGIPVPVGEPELVEVRRRTVALDETVAVPGKERQLAGAQMQREILLETQREQDLVQLGKVMGAYDRGDQQELQEKKMLFESMNTEPLESPLKRRQSELQKSLSVDGPVVVVVPIESNHEAPSSPAPPTEVKKGPSYAEANGNNIIIIEHGSILRRSAPAPVLSSTPAEPLRSSPAALRRSTPADLRFSRSSSGSSPLPNHDSPSSPFQVLSSPSSRSLLEREIEEVQQRESELRRQRSNIYGKDYSEEDSAQRTPQNRDDILSGVYQPERPNWGKLEVNWPPNRGSALNGEADQASDSPRTRRQRSALIQSWESGNPSPREEP